MSQTILYARVSTADQTLKHQKTHAEAAGFAVDDVIADHGVSAFLRVYATERAENGCMTVSVQGIPSSCVGWTVWDETTRT